MRNVLSNVSLFYFMNLMAACPYHPNCPNRPLQTVEGRHPDELPFLLIAGRFRAEIDRRFAGMIVRYREWLRGRRDNPGPNLRPEFEEDHDMAQEIALLEIHFWRCGGFPIGSY